MQAGAATRPNSNQPDEFLLLFLTVGAFVGLMTIALAVARSRAFDALALYDRGKTANLDGLRGFLAFGVFLAHAAFYHNYIRSGAWTNPPLSFLKLGQIGVSLFFMITGYLFWQKLIIEEGRPDWVRLYLGRVFRIGPLYLFAIAAMFVVVAERTDFAVQVPAGDLAVQVARWLPLGFNGGGGDVNGLQSTGLILLGVTWTLGSEWKYYLALLPLSLVCRRSTTHLPFVLSVIAASVIYSLLRPDLTHAAQSIRVLLFALGMLAASLEAKEIRLSPPRPFGALALLACLGTVVGAFPTAFAVVPCLMLGAVFLLIVFGEDLFGLLTTRAARRIGEVSYGIYLLQGIVFTLFFSNAALREWLTRSDSLFALYVAICGVSLLLLAYGCFVWIEKPGIRLGQRLSSRLSGRRRLEGPAPTASRS